jgi:hypothetical protein
MTRARKLALGLLALELGSVAAAAELEFSGYVAGELESRFVIFDAATKERSGLLTIGQRFGGYQLIGFDRAQETLTLQRGSEVLRLKRKQPMAGAAADPTSPWSSNAAGPVPSWQNDLYATKAERERTLKAIQKAIGEAPVPFNSVPRRPGRR